MVDVSALGENVLSTWNDGSYAQLQGTSMSTPFISGLCALLLAYDRVLSKNKGLEKRICNSHCMKDILSKIAFNSGSELAKGGGSLDLDNIISVEDLFDKYLNEIR